MRCLSQVSYPIFLGDPNSFSRFCTFSNMTVKQFPGWVFKPFLALLLLHLTMACSEGDTDPAPLAPEVSFTAFGNTGSEEIQMDVTSRSGDPLLISLTEELGLSELPFYLRNITNTSVGYYFWQDQQSRVRYKDLKSGELFFADDICDFSLENIPGRAIRRVSGNEGYVVMPYAEFPDGRDPLFSMRTLNRETGECQDYEVPEVNISGIESYSIEGRLLALYYLQDGTDTPLITLVDLETGIIKETLILDGTFQAATFRGTDLWIFNRDDTFLIYNTESGTFSRSGSAPGLPSQGPGMFNSRFDGNRLLVDVIYQQPSLFFAQPAVYDFDQGTLSQGADPFLPELQERVERETGDRVLFGKYGVDLSTGTIAIIYVRGNGATEGGVVLTNFEQEWLEVIPLPYVPEQVEIREVR